MLRMKGSDVVGPTAIASTETQVGGADLVLPAWARSILAIRPMTANATPVALEGVVHKLHLESEDFSIQPYEVLCAPTGPAVENAVTATTTGSMQAPEAPWYPVNCPVNGGDRLKVFGNELRALTNDAYMMCQIILSDKKPGGQYHARVGGAWTTTGAAGIYTPGTAYTVTGGHTLEEIYGVYMPDGVLLEGGMGYFEFRSNDFEDPTPLKLPTNPISPNIDNGGVNTTGLARAKIEVAMLSPCKITGSLTLTDVSAGDFITGVLYR